MKKNFWEQIFTDNMVAIVLLGLCFFGLIKYVDYRFSLMEVETSWNSLETSLLAKDVKSDLTYLHDTILGTTSNLTNVLEQEKEKNDSLKDKLSGITDTVESLEKLSMTDKELLKKYSKVYFLNEHYVPVSLSDIEPEFRTKNSTNYQFHSDAISFLEDLIKEGEDNGVHILAQSAYRSFGIQSALKASYTFIYGAGTANQFSADQGYSEHQLGTALDFTTDKLNGTLEGFDKTPEYEWMKDNAHKFGFILSYPAGNTYYKFEPWHWRFVGVDLATRLFEDEVSFYDMDQRVIDTYLGNIFD